jgi:hypothetical protein
VGLTQVVAERGLYGQRGARNLVGWLRADARVADDAWKLARLALAAADELFAGVLPGLVSGQLRQLGAQLREAAAPEQRAREEQDGFARRGLRICRSLGGCGEITGRLHAEAAEQVIAAFGELGAKAGPDDRGPRRSGGPTPSPVCAPPPPRHHSQPPHPLLEPSLPPASPRPGGRTRQAGTAARARTAAQAGKERQVKNVGKLRQAATTAATATPGLFQLVTSGPG